MSGAVKGDVMDKHVRRNLEHIIITRKIRLSYSKLSNLFAKEILNQTLRLQQIKEKISGISNRSGERLSSKEKIIRYMKPEKVRICLLPDIRGVNETHVLPRSENVVSCCIGSTYGSYCSFIARTYLFNPNEFQLNAYRVLFQAQEAAIAALQPGSRIRDIYNSALAVVQNQDVHGFVEYIGNTVGMGIGIEFNETYLELNATNEVHILLGMVFKVVVSLNNVQPTNGEMFSMILGDTVIVGETGVPPRVVTLSLKKVEEVVCRSKKESEGSSGAKDLKMGNQEVKVYQSKRPKKRSAITKLNSPQCKLD
ncbi:FACT complex subunit SPT16-like [Papaver somniferum]|uniref:FACT complex subunit SPT16-like n=1 Tax=Papaver somniferum TaxID=3469 RepID=UPI000E6FC3D2|nr:FACT complex subunit SPT16-like [Papaver somniferum]